jgi:hypothetical protein
MKREIEIRVQIQTPKQDRDRTPIFYKMVVGFDFFGGSWMQDSAELK